MIRSVVGSWRLYSALFDAGRIHLAGKRVEVVFREIRHEVGMA